MHSPYLSVQDINRTRGGFATSNTPTKSLTATCISAAQMDTQGWTGLRAVEEMGPDCMELASSVAQGEIVSGMFGSDELLECIPSETDK